MILRHIFLYPPNGCGQQRATDCRVFMRSYLRSLYPSQMHRGRVTEGDGMKVILGTSPIDIYKIIFPAYRFYLKSPSLRHLPSPFCLSLVNAIVHRSPGLSRQRSQPEIVIPIVLVRHLKTMLLHGVAELTLLQDVLLGIFRPGLVVVVQGG